MVWSWFATSIQLSREILHVSFISEYWMFSRLYLLNLSFECKISGSWSTEETKTLISIWSEESVLSRVDSAHWNWHIFEQIAHQMTRGMRRHGSNAEQNEKPYIEVQKGISHYLKIDGFCIAKFCFPQVQIKDHNNVSGNNRENWIYFNQLILY